MYLKLSQYSQENTCAAGLKARSFPVNIAKSFKNCFLKKHFRWLLYSDTIYDQTYKSLFQTKYLNLYSLMIYLAIIGAVRGTSSGKASFTMNYNGNTFNFVVSTGNRVASLKRINNFPSFSI